MGLGRRITKLLLSSVLLSLFVGFLCSGLAAAQETSDSGYVAYVRFRYNTTNSMVRASATLSVWNPNVTRAEDYSLGMVSLVQVDPQTQNITASMESGYIVFPARYGDNRTRFYIRWTNVAANGTRTGCFDLDCQGFVPTSAGRGRFGRPIGYSQPGQRPTGGIVPDIYKDNTTGNWVLERNNLRIGYWPPSLFTQRDGNFNSADLGGEVYDSTGDTTPSSQMGNGQDPTEGRFTGAYIYDVVVQDHNDVNVPLGSDSANQLLSNPSCYAANFYGYISGVTEGTSLFYGGPGCDADQ